MSLASSHLDSLLDDATAPAIDITMFFPPLTEMSRYRTAHRWMRDDDCQHCFCCRHFDGGETDSSMDIHVGWHNIELLRMTHAVRNVWYPLLDDGWKRRFHISRYLCAPTSFFCFTISVVVSVVPWSLISTVVNMVTMWILVT